MAKSLDDNLAKLVALKGQPATPEARAELAKALTSKANLIVAKAAKLIVEMKLSDLGPEMIRAFDRLLQAGTAADKGCFAKTELATVIDVLDIPDAQSVFLAGAQHFQPEPVWGGSADTATGLRAACAVGLVRNHYRDAILELADLLADPEPPVRVAAARALALSERDDAAPLLRLKILTGDRESDVVAECLTALLALAPRKSLKLAERLLDSPDAIIQNSAALGLGATRLPEAFDVLRRNFERVYNEDSRRSILVGIALLRSLESLEFLLQQISDATTDVAVLSVEALVIYRQDASVVEKISSSIGCRKSEALRKAFETTFGR